MLTSGFMKISLHKTRSEHGSPMSLEGPLEICNKSTSGTYGQMADSRGIRGIRVCNNSARGVTGTHPAWTCSGLFGFVLLKHKYMELMLNQRETAMFPRECT